MSNFYIPQVVFCILEAIVSALKLKSNTQYIIRWAEHVGRTGEIKLQSSVRNSKRKPL